MKPSVESRSDYLRTAVNTIAISAVVFAIMNGIRYELQKNACLNENIPALALTEKISDPDVRTALATRVKGEIQECFPVLPNVGPGL